MADIQITTTQNVIIDFTSTDAGKRIVAYLLDLLIKVAYVFVMIFLITQSASLIKFADFLGDKEDLWSVMAIMSLIGLPIMFYTLILEAIMEGQTLGKKIMQIQVVKIDGYQAHFFDYFIRWVFRIIDISMFSGIVALIVIGSSKKQQRLGGMASGTAVINKKNKINISHTILQELDQGYQPVYASVINLSDNDVRIVKEHMEKALKAKDHGLLLKLKDKVIEVIKVKPEEGVTAENFLKTVIKDYNHYTAA